MNFLDIPIIVPNSRPQQVEHVPWTPSSPDEPPQYEYEFSNYWHGVLYFVHLWDTSDVSACERVCNRPITEADITYSSTGNGFVQDDELKYTFTKQPIRRSVVLPDIATGVKYEKGKTADDILASL